MQQNERRIFLCEKKIANNLKQTDQIQERSNQIIL